MLEMAGWICGGVFLFGVVAFVGVYIYGTRSMAKDQERFEREGELQMCWISSAEDDLYKIHDVPGTGNARVVFLRGNVANHEALLKDITDRLISGRKEDPHADPAQVRAFFEKINKQHYLDAPVRLPQWLVGDLEAYTGMMQVYWRKLPALKLDRPYVYSRVILGDKGGIRHVPYPANEARAGRYV